MDEIIEPTDKDLLLIELSEDVERVDEALHCCHREFEHDRHIRLSEKRDALLKRIDYLKAQP